MATPPAIRGAERRAEKFQDKRSLRVMMAKQG